MKIRMKSRLSLLKSTQAFGLGFCLLLSLQAQVQAEAQVQTEGEDKLLLDLEGLQAGDAIPVQWQPLQFDGLTPTEYRLVDDSNSDSDSEDVVLCGYTDASASGLIYRVAADEQHYSHIAWNWKISNVYQRARLGEKEGDDFPARIYISFQYQPEHADWSTSLTFEGYRMLYGEYPPVAVLNYVWASENELVADTAVDRIVTSPYSTRSKMLVVRSGGALRGQWQREIRNIAEDYRRAFAGDPPPISGVALMSDADNTGESASACFSRVRLITDR